MTLFAGKYRGKGEAVTINTAGEKEKVIIRSVMKITQESETIYNIDLKNEITSAEGKIFHENFTTLFIKMDKVLYSGAAGYDVFYFDKKDNLVHSFTQIYSQLTGSYAATIIYRKK